MAAPFPGFIPTLKKLTKILGAPATTVRKWCKEQTKRKTINPVTKKKKTINDKILKLPLLQKLLLEIVDKINDITDQIILITVLEKKVYDIDKRLYELGIRHDEELLQLSDREIAESQRLDAARIDLRDRRRAESQRLDADISDWRGLFDEGELEWQRNRPLGAAMEHVHTTDEFGTFPNRLDSSGLRRITSTAGYRHSDGDGSTHDWVTDNPDNWVSSPIFTAGMTGEMGGPIPKFQPGGRTKPVPTRKLKAGGSIQIGDIVKDMNIT